MYYPIFRWAVHDFKAGYPRVTHPFATNPKKKNNQPKFQVIQKGSFDLHTLGTQPTFILSYDQTLIEKRLTYTLHT